MKNNQNGFSLVELMVVVAIIGILATVAIPSVTKYMAKARQSEAKANLASLYSAEKAFYVEHSFYASHFQNVGHGPEGQIRYNYGFGVGTTAAEYASMGFFGAAVPNVFSAGRACISGGSFNCTLMREGRNRGMITGAPLVIPDGPTFDVGPTANVTYSPPSFRAMATSALTDWRRPDTWTVNSDKVFINPQSGL